MTHEDRPQASVRTFERPLPDGWAYPCAISDLRATLDTLPDSDLQGLWTVGLVPASRKDSGANARYYGGERPVIHVYSLPEGLRYKLPPHTSSSEIERGFAVEL